VKLKDRVAIVTGGARGIGKAYVLRLAEEGAKVVIADIQDSKGVEQAVISKGGEALSLRTDVTDEESTIEMARMTVERFGGIDVLVNNAAYFADIIKKPFHEITGEDWDAVLRVNLKGPFLCSKAVYPQMKKQGKGKIINISSGTFFHGSTRFLHYVTSKGGIIGFTRAMARELGDTGICVNAIAPGYTETEILRERPQDPPEVIHSSVARRCFKRPEKPEDLTGALVFLASDDSDFITGQTIAVDGGAAMH